MVKRFCALLLCLAFAGSALADAKEDKRRDIRQGAEAALQQLYKMQPQAKAAIEKSAGYAVFSNFGMKILLAGGGQGYGLAVDRKTKQETFMKMVEVQAGLGVGVKRFKLVWVFDSPQKLDDFINKGWEVGAQATAAAQMGGKGQELYAGAVSVSPGVWLYQITGDGLAVELTAKGTKYFKDGDLN